MEGKLDGELERMARIPWSTMEAVGDQSEYVNNLSASFSNSIPMLAGLLSPIYFHFFLDKLAASFAPRYYATIFKCRRLSGTGAQQMLLDTHGIKTILLELPALGGLTSTAAYSKYVSREVGKSEALLKVILSPVENIVDTYRALLPEGSSNDFFRMLELKGVRKQDQPALVDSLAAKLAAAAPPQPPPSATPAPPSASTASGIPPSSSQPSASALAGSSGTAAANSASTAATAAAAAAAGMLTSAASREAMIARAAALGRGAMAQSAAAAAAVSQTTALKRIFALADTTGSGSKKDMSFRSLFNA
eukprot:TRINITY_DN65750_c0_g2_i1.p1 TRINITY_DN65750_c0_g2~~TRINITY_DN65750_c0_g2_i1.p1  ORF type:complete len:316 (+),score=20.22 TRINITY_DN65750_c0_g2_i1:32-949(+)